MKNAREVGSISATRPPAGTPRRANSSAKRCAAACNSPNVMVELTSPAGPSSVISRCVCSALRLARYRSMSTSVSAENTPASTASRCRFCAVAAARSADSGSANSSAVPGIARIACARSSGVSASEATRSSKRTPNALSSRVSSSTRSRLPNPSSRSNCEERLSIGRAPWLPSSLSKVRMTSSTRSRTAEVSSCVAGVATICI